MVSTCCLVDIQVSSGLGQFREFGGVANANCNLRQEEHIMTPLLPSSSPYFSFCADDFLFFCTSAFTCVFFSNEYPTKFTVISAVTEYTFTFIALPNMYCTKVM